MIRKPPRTIVWCAVATALSLLGDQALYALLPLYFTELGLAPFQVGIILSANRWIRLLTNHLAERLIHVFSPHWLFMASLLLGAVITLAYAWIDAFVVLLAARLLWGLCWSFIRHISIMSVAMTSDSLHLGQSMGFYNGISRTGSIGGILLGGILFDLMGYESTFTLFFAVSLLAVVAAATAGVSRQPEHAAEWHNPDPGRGSVSLLVCGFTIGSVGPGLIMSTLGFVLLTRYGNSIDLPGFTIGVATLTGVLLGTRWLLDTIGAPFYGAVVDRIGVHRGVPALFVAGFLSLVFLVFTFDLALLGVGIVLFFMCGTALYTVVAGEASRRGSRLYARYATAGDIGAAFGPVIGWTSYEFFDLPNLAFVLGAGLYLVGLAAALIAFPSAHQTSKAVDQRPGEFGGR